MKNLKALATLVLLALIFQEASSMSLTVLGHSSSSNMEAKKMEANFAKALASITNKGPQASAIANVDRDNNSGNSSDLGNLSSAKPAEGSWNASLSGNASLSNDASLSKNASLSGNFSANTTALNNSSQAESLAGPKTDPAAQDTAIALGSDSAVALQGSGSPSVSFWGVQADQHGIGKPAISSQTFLRGDFQVDKTLQFKDRSY